MKKATCIVILIITILLGSFMGCTESNKDLEPVGREEPEVPMEVQLAEPGRAVNLYLRYWQEGDYEKAYSLLSDESRELIDQEDFITRYENIYSGIRLESLEAEVTSMQEEPEWVEISLAVKYHTHSVDTLELNMELSMILEEEAWRVIWSPALIFPQLREGDVIRVITAEPERGEIYSAGGELLAQNGTTQVVLANVETVGEDREGFAGRLAPLLAMEPDQILDRLASNPDEHNRIVIRHYLPGTLDEQLSARILEIPGTGVFSGMYSREVRLYPNDSMLFQTLGYVGLMSDMEYETYREYGYRNDQRIGKMGLERALELELYGRRGYEIAVYREDEKISTIASLPKKNGSTIELTIDMGIQRKAEALLKEHIKEAQSGAVVVLDPDTGAVLAMANAPTFDPNQFALGISQSLWDSLNQPEAGQPLFNRAVEGLYPPGSVIKPFTAAMGLESGLLTSAFAFQGEVVDDRWVAADEPGISITRYSGYDGEMNLENAMIHSDNIYFAYTVLQLGGQDFQEYAQKYGMTENIPFELAVRSGRISNENNILTNRALLADTGYGQGEMLMTPLHLAVLFSAFANDGDIIAPYLVQSRRDPETDAVMQTGQRVWREQAVSSGVVGEILPTLVKVVTDGTGRAVGVPGMEIAGKTGTAELDDAKTREIAWFAGFTTQGEQRRLVCIMLDVPTGQGEARYTIARELLKD